MSFRPARFQIREIVGDKKRGDEWRQRQDRYDSAASVSDVTDPWVSSQPLSFSELSQLVAEALTGKAAHYGPNGCSQLDALVYVDLDGRHLFAGPVSLSETSYEWPGRSNRVSPP